MRQCRSQERRRPPGSDSAPAETSGDLSSEAGTAKLEGWVPPESSASLSASRREQQGVRLRSPECVACHSTIGYLWLEVLKREGHTRGTFEACSRMSPAHDPIESLRAIVDAHERLTWLTDRGRTAPPLAPAERVPANRVPGCVSAVWLVDDSCGGLCRFRGEAEAPILRGLVALICERANGRPAAEVSTDTVDVVTALELERHLSPTRTQGLRALQAHVRAQAGRHGKA